MDSGNLAYFRQKRDGLDEYIEGNADKLEYDGKRDFTTLTGRAVVRRLQGLSKVIDTVSGNVITYDGQKDFYTASSNSGSSSGSGRVRAMLAPAVNNGASAPAGASATATPNAASGASTGGSSTNSNGSGNSNGTSNGNTTATPATKTQGTDKN
jgi:lipopolysaccharide export system protein LptA